MQEHMKENFGVPCLTNKKYQCSQSVIAKMCSLLKINVIEKYEETHEEDPSKNYSIKKEIIQKVGSKIILNSI